MKKKVKDQGYTPLIFPIVLIVLMAHSVLFEEAESWLWALCVVLLVQVAILAIVVRTFRQIRKNQL
jgi:predicted ferric reductase